MINFILSQYFQLRQIVPIFIYTFYYFLKNRDHPIIDALVKTGLIAIGLGTLYATMCLIFRVPLTNRAPFNWYYQGPITWGSLFIAYSYILTQKEENPLTSFTLATLAVVGGGWLYEVPFFHPLSMFLGRSFSFYITVQIICLLFLASELKKKIFRPNPLIYVTLILCEFLNRSSFYYPNIQILCLLVLGYELMKMDFKPNKLIWSTLILFLVFSFYLFLNKDHLCCISREWYMVLAYGYRGPASLFLLSLLSGVKQNV